MIKSLNLPLNFQRLTAIKQLAGQTLWYGGSNIAAKFLNYLLTPLLTYLMVDNSGMREYGNYSLLYSWIAIVNILFTYGFETGYFRFSNKEGVDREVLFHTTFGSLLVSSFSLVFLLSLFCVPINDFLGLGNHPEYIIGVLLLIALDAIAAIPFARLRQENRPRKYAFVKVTGIVVNISFILLFLVVLPRWIQQHPDSLLATWYRGQDILGFLILANLIQNLFVVGILYPEWRTFRFKINTRLWRQIFAYSAPMIVVGLAGMVNEVLDRQMLAAFLPLPEEEKKILVGVYAANYKIAIFITLFIQAFRMAAEPFFFNQSREKNAPVTYARVMKWFVITLALAFLFTALYLDVWKYMVGAPYRNGLGVVPILLVANILLGIYYNLSVWYKLTDRMAMGMYITFFGAVITIMGNYWFIPKWGYYASAWTTLVCYLSMVVVTYFIGKRYFPVPYPVKKILAYLACMLSLYLMHRGVVYVTGTLAFWPQMLLRLLAATVFMGLFLMLVFKVEKKELKTMPFIGRYIP